jgi:hypothetical protein
VELLPAVKNRHGGLHGRGRGKGRRPVRGTVGKAPVIGAIARKGNVVCQAVASVDGETIREFVRETVSNKVKLVATDEHSGYARLKIMGYPHETVDHRRGEYVRDRSTPRISVLVPREARHRRHLPQGQRRESLRNADLKTFDKVLGKAIRSAEPRR